MKVVEKEYRRKRERDMKKIVRISLSIFNAPVPLVFKYWLDKSRASKVL